MKSVQVREAKASLSHLIEAAESGKPTMITKHGQPAAVLIPVDDATKLYGDQSRNFGAFLLTYPGGAEFERRTDVMRDIDI